MESFNSQVVATKLAHHRTNSLSNWDAVSRLTKQTLTELTLHATNQIKSYITKQQTNATNPNTQTFIF